MACGQREYTTIAAMVRPKGQPPSRPAGVPAVAALAAIRTTAAGQAYVGCIRLDPRIKSADGRFDALIDRLRGLRRQGDAFTLCRAVSAAISEAFSGPLNLDDVREQGHRTGGIDPPAVASGIFAGARPDRGLAG